MAMLHPYLTVTLLALTASLTACRSVSNPATPPQDIASRPSETQLQSSRSIKSIPVTPSPIAPSGDSFSSADGAAVESGVSAKPATIEANSDRSTARTPARLTGTSETDSNPEPDKPAPVSAPSASVFPEVNSIKLDADQYLSSITDPDPALEQAIRQEIPDYQGEMPDGFEVRYSYNQVDLDGDAIPEVLVYLSGYYTCGSGGCTMLIFQQKDQSEASYELVSRIRLVNAPVLVSAKTTTGWQDLILYVAGGGVEPYYALLQYDGKGYPTNPSVAPEVPAAAVVKGTAILTDGIDINEGVLLEPAQS